MVTSAVVDESLPEDEMIVIGEVEGDNERIKDEVLDAYLDSMIENDAEVEDNLDEQVKR